MGATLQLAHLFAYLRIRVHVHERERERERERLLIDQLECHPSRLWQQIE